jgi:hypothetical protein
LQPLGYTAKYDIRPVVKKLRVEILAFYNADKGVLFYGGTLALLIVAIFINYSPLIDLQWVEKSDNQWMWLAHYFALYGGLYYTTALLGAKGSAVRYLQNPWFWALSAAFILLTILPKLHVFPLVNIHNHPEWSGGEKIFAYKSHFFIHQLVITGLGLLFLKMVCAKWIQLDFGLRINVKQLRPYFLMLLAISPLMLAASFLPDFQRAYPQYQPWSRMDMAFGLTDATRTALFTACYSTGFIAVELLFRGALAIAMVQLMGTRAILPMAAFYCAFHFGKPLGEAISSVVGGYILGVLAVNSRSIAGGILVHLGVAMLMEFAGHVQHGLR